jgi:hypothetical protein
MAFHRTYEMSLRIARKKLAMNDVDVFAAVKNHEFVTAPLFIGLVKGWSLAKQATGAFTVIFLRLPQDIFEALLLVRPANSPGFAYA